MAKKKRPKSKAAQVTEATRSERREERWAKRAETEKHPDRVDFQSRQDQEIFKKREPDPADQAVAQSWKTGLVMLLIVGGATAFLIFMFVRAGPS